MNLSPPPFFLEPTLSSFPFFLLEPTVGEIVTTTAPPHIILRHGLIKGMRYSTLATDMGTYLARTLFFTSGLHLSGPQLKEAVGRWSSNWPMCELTEQVGYLKER